MFGLWRRIGVVVILCGLTMASARAEPLLDRRALELSGFLGAHLFADQSALGDTDYDDAAIAGSVGFGPRLSRSWSRWLTLEAEFLISVSGAKNTDQSASVLILAPRVQNRVDILDSGPARPFAVVGLGMPISLSSKRYLIGSDISASLYAGGGVRLMRTSYWNLRADVRVFAVPARGDGLVAPELEITVGLYRSLRRSSDNLTGWGPIGRIVDRDRDGDGIDDGVDACPEREEDRDGFEDADGCPEVDNDFDMVLDIADRCAEEPETLNGFEDEDGCPDSIPRDLERLLGPVEGLTFRPASSRLPPRGRRALRRIARVMLKHGSVRILITGHADTREVKDDDEAQDLSLARAQAVRDFLVAEGLEEWRIRLVGAGTSQPVASSKRRRGQRLNRRVEIELRVYTP